MAWNTTLVTMVRNLIGDTSTTSPTYANARIEEAIAVSAYFVINEYPLATDYTINIDTPSITPDPTTSDPIDKIAIALFPLRAACMLNLNNYQTAATNSISVKDGDASVSTTDGYKGWESVIRNGPCYAYKTLLERLQYKNTAANFRAVTTPQNILGFYHNGCISIGRFYNSFF